MKFVFENLSEHLNFIDCPDINKSGIRRFAPSPISIGITSRISNLKLPFSKWFRPKNYIIATGVNHSPREWVGGSLCVYQGRKSVFEHIHPEYLKDLRKGRAMLMLDQSLEGHQTTWLWNWFHEECERYQIRPSAIIYVTGNLSAKNQYKEYADLSSKTDRINVICYPIFEQDVPTIAQDHNVGMIYNESLEYKTKNNNDIKLFNCQQKRLRPHRLWFYNYLNKHQLKDLGLVSQNNFTAQETFLDGQVINEQEVKELNKNLPSLIYNSNNDQFPDSFYIRRIVKSLYLDSWITVVSEVAYGNQDNSIFISEKTFKAIAGCHPFILLSSKGSLKALRQLGYKTFHPLINETYDTLDTFDRFEAICTELKRLNDIEDKVAWFKELEPIIKHNWELMNSRHNQLPPCYPEVELCYRSYFK